MTNKASWSAAESWVAGAYGPSANVAGVSFPTPGVPAVDHTIDVYMRADYSVATVVSHGVSAHGYQLTTTGDALPLGHFEVLVVSSPCGPGLTCNAVTGATVEVFEGEGVGRSGVTNSNGTVVIDFLRFNAPFAVRASKPGYATVETSLTGIADDAGYPGNASTHLVLVPK